MAQTTAAPVARRRRTRAVLVMASALGVLVAVGVGWVVLAGHLRNELQVTMSTPDCTGTDSAWIDVDGRPTPALRLVPAMHCTLSFVVTNPARVPVQLKSMRLPVLGPGATAAVRVDSVNDGAFSLRRGVDAVADLDVRLDSGERVELVISFSFRPRGCTAGIMWVRDVPLLQVAALGRSGTVGGGQTLAFKGTPASDCSP